MGVVAHSGCRSNVPQSFSCLLGPWTTEGPAVRTLGPVSTGSWAPSTGSGGPGGAPWEENAAPRRESCRGRSSCWAWGEAQASLDTCRAATACSPAHPSTSPGVVPVPAGPAPPGALYRQVGAQTLTRDCRCNVSTSTCVAASGSDFCGSSPRCFKGFLVNRAGCIFPVGGKESTGEVTADGSGARREGAHLGGLCALSLQPWARPRTTRERPSPAHPRPGAGQREAPPPWLLGPVHSSWGCRKPQTA